MKIKVNQDKQTVTIKGLSTLEFSVIEALLNHVRMGQEQWDGGASAVPFEFSRALEEAAEELSYLDLEEISVVAVPSEEVEGLSLIIDAPTIEVYVE